jgi:cytidyltransferase-like protein
VFDYNGITYKFTGNFAPTNQILGMERFQRFGPIEPQEGAESPLEGDSRPRIAIVPGAFKPPHKGHLAMVERLAEVADKVIVIISRPTKAGRALPSGKVVDSNHAEQIWRAYLDKSPAGDKTEVIQSPAASPVAVTYDFVMKEPDPNNPLVAPPNATVVLGCGDKEDDQGRYRGITSKAREDLDIKIQVCPMVVKHSNEYMKLIKSNPTISQYIPSVAKTTVDSSDFHASDMRSVIDLASQDPVGLELLKDFVPRPEDAVAVLGALGLNPADSFRPEEDQVEEPEIDSENLKEFIENTVECLLQEDFKAQRAPKAGPSNSKFQKSMRKRLSKSHKTYLDMGRHDLTKHGGGFHLDRVKDKSNSFLAEDQEEIEEMSCMAAGDGAGYAAPLGTKRLREDEELKEQEKDLRKFIRLGIKEFFETKKKERQDLIEYVIQEHELRLSLRNMILEQEAPNVDGSDSTGINTLKDFMKNTNVLATLREVYKTLTTDLDQRRSFRAHIIAWIRDTLAPVKLNDVKPEGIAEQVGVDIEGVGDETVAGDEEKFIDATDGSEKERPEEPEEEEKMKPISGADTTGRNKAERVYPTIEKSIIDYYGELDNPEDQELFYDYLIANMKLYFDKWENEMSDVPPEEPTNDEYEQAKNTEENPGLSAS